MKIVIDIPEDVYKRTVFYREFKDLNDCVTTIKALEKGTPLPEHHGLIDKLELSDNIKNRLMQTAMNNTEVIMPYSKVCEDIVDNRIDTWIDEVRTIIEGSDSE